ncbi:hypothetical protein BC941DRAFT_441555 [Chlamydoabsidia padenii]|nr:hypothetical protein BC941DRAFT_441555 [Chlamydoabsidia padenii]
MLKFKRQQQQENNEGDDGATIEKTTPAMNSTRYSHDMIILDNYTNMSENQAFAIHLIVHYFLPTFYTTSTSTTSSSSILAPGFSGTYNGDHSIQSCSQYAIQEILKAVAITSNRILGREEKGEGGGGGRDRRKSRSIMGRSAGNNNNSNYKDVNAAFNLETRKLWFSLDPMIKDVIQPLLHSKFEADIQVIPRAPPLYALAGDSFEAWIQSFYYFLLEKVNTNTEVLPIFNACVPSVKVGHTLLTQHLIPFLILRVLLSSSSSSSSSFATPSTSTFDTPSIQHDHQLILDEIIGVLENDSFGVDMKQRTLQMVVSITGHCQSWIRQKLQLKKKQLKHTSSLCKEDAEIYAVKTFLTKIPNGLMTKAAFQTGNYPQAMMHFELYLKEVQKQKRPLQQQPLSNEYLDVICQTYMKLEGPETMPEILSKFDSHMTPQLEILQFESSGDWHLAKLVYERLLPTTTATQKEGSGDNSNQQLLCRYFNCLRRLNDYDRIINYSNEMLKDQSRGLPYALLEQVNTYRAEAAWKSGNWYLLHECLKLPMDDSFEASIACALAHMQCNNPLAVHLTLEQGRLNEVKRICQKSSGGVAAASYQKSYDAVLRLQLLQEIDSIMTLMEPHQQGVFQHVIKQEQGQTSAAITNVDNDPFLLWKLKFLKVKPSYASQRQLLDLRLVAEFELWKTNNNHNEATMSETEKKLRLLLAKTARKAKDLTTAFGAIYQEPLLSEPLALIQLAKWNLERKDPKTCSRYLNDRRIANLPKAKYMAARYKESQCNNMIRKTTHPARYQDEVEKIAAHYSDVRKTMPNWEKIFYVSGSFTEQTYGMAENDPKYFIRAAEAIQHYCEALKIGSRYYYSTMPRLLSLWLRISEQMKSALTVGSKFSDDMNVAITQAYSSANQTLSDYVDQIPPYLFGLALPRLVSRLAIKDEEAVKILSKMIVKVLISYPRSTIWSLQYALHSDDHNVSSITANILREAEALQPNSLVTKIIHQTEQFTKYLEIMAKYKKLGRSPNIPVLGGKTLFESNFPELLAMKHLDICIPQETAMLPSLPESLSSAPTTTSNIYGSRHHQPYPVDLPTIVRVLPTVQVMSSLQQPKRLSFLASDGKIYNFLCKCNDELRKDARMMEFSHMINKFLIKNATSRQQQLYIRTYAVIPLGVRWGLIEWINNLNTLKSIVCDKWEAADPIDGPDRLNRLRMMMKTRNESSRCTVDDKVDLLVNHVYPQSPVVFASWFLDTFPEPSDWFASRSRYVRTLAVMSIVGYVLGLGDRHAENIMFDATNGDTVHVDVNMLFDHGHDLTVPEIVPFRLTRNLIDAMGVTKETGLFRRACMITLEVLREHRLQLLSVFETFLFDPIDERRRRDANLSHQQTARKAINVIDNKIQTKHLVKTTVDMLIKEASSNLNLAQMFFGWSPFL